MQRSRRRALPAVLTALGLATPLLAAAPVTAAPDRVVYDALGDSYAAGFGTSSAPAACGRSELAYPHVLDGRMRIELDDLAACSGAVAGSSSPNNITAQLGSLDDATGLVTVSIGGNDVGWFDAVTACLFQPEQACDAAVTAAEARIGALPQLLGPVYEQIRAEAPHAHVVVTGYPRLFSPEHGDYTGVLPGVGTPFLVTVAEQERLNAGADELNRVIRAAAEEAGFQFVDVTKRFEGHGVNSPDAWIGGIEDPELFHPTAEGQHAYGVALRSQISPRDLR